MSKYLKNKRIRKGMKFLDNLDESKKKKIKVGAFCLGISFILLFLCSKCSFLYPFNGWDDFNTFYTMASSWFNGLMPYRDLFEQKGPFLYVIFLIGYLISPGKFTGIFIVEIIFFSLTLYVSSKIIDMFIDEKKYPKGKYLVLLLYGVMITTSISFIEGGSCEEFNLLFTTLTTFYIIKYLKNGDLVDINYKDLIICGLCCGLSLMIKYTTIGLWFIMMAYICIKLFILKRYKEAILKGLVFIIMMLLPFGLFSIYFYMNDSLLAFLDTYFFINIFKYSSEGGILSKILFSFINIFYGLFSNFVLVAMGYLIFNHYLWTKVRYGYNFKLSKKQGLFLGINLFYLIILYYSQDFRTYAITVAFFLILLVIIYFYKMLNSYKLFKITCVGYIFVALLIRIDFDYIKANRNEVVQYRFADIINQEENPTLLHYRSIDEGFYTAAGILPTKRFFQQVNITRERMPESYLEQDMAIINQEVTFVVVRLFDLKKKEFLSNYPQSAKKDHNNKIDLYLIETFYDLVDVYESNVGYYDNCIYYLYKVKE